MSLAPPSLVSEFCHDPHCTSLISELACEMEEAGKGNKSLYKKENCPGMCDKMCSLKVEGKKERLCLLK